MTSSFVYPFENEKVDVTQETCQHAPQTFPQGQQMWEFASMSKMKEILQSRKNVIPNSLFIDVGAQVGLYSLTAKFFPQLQYHAFEPFPKSAKCLKDNIALNQLKNVQVHEKAVSNVHGTQTTLQVSKSHNGLHTLGAQPLRFSDTERVQVETVTLDQMFPVEKVEYIKVDTEGWEYFVLLGAQKILERCKPILQLEINETNMRQCGVSRQDLLSLLEKYGYVLQATVNDEENFFI